MHETGFIHDLALVLGVAAIAGLIFRLLRQPSILGYLFAGLIVGPYLPFPLFADPKRVHALSEFGVVLVMFAVGLEFRMQKFFKVLPIAGVTALIEMGALATAGYFLGRLLGWTEIGSLFLGACICISSTMAVSKIFEQQPVEPESRSFVYGVLVLQDVAAIALITIMTALAQGVDASAGHVLEVLGKLLVVLSVMIAIGMFFVPRLIQKFNATASTETLVVGAVGVCFTFAVLAENLGYSAALGAFIAGVLVAESGLGKTVEHSIASVRDIFASVFFVSIGMSVDPRIAWETLPTAGLVLCVVIIAQFLSVTIGGVLSGSGILRSVTAGISLGQIGEFAFIIGSIGVAGKVVGPELHSVLVTVAVLSTFTTAVFLRRRDRIARGIERHLPDRLHRVLSIYEAWFDDLRSAPNKPGQGMRRIVVAIALDLLLMFALLLWWRTHRDEVGLTLVRFLGMDKQMNETVSMLALFAALLPLLVPLIWGARELSHRLADRVLGTEASHANSLLRSALSLLMIAGMGVPGTLLLARLVGVNYVWPALFAGLAISASIAWHKVRVLDKEIQFGGVRLVRAIADQGMPEADRQSLTSPLTGLANLQEITLKSGDHAVGKDLASLHLRSVTGASVVAMRRDTGVNLPHATEELMPGDTLFIAGQAVDQAAAAELLSTGKKTAKPEVVDD